MQIKDHSFHTQWWNPQIKNDGSKPFEKKNLFSKLSSQAGEEY